MFGPRVSAAAQAAVRNEWRVRGVPGDHLDDDTIKELIGEIRAAAKRVGAVYDETEGRRVIPEVMLPVCRFLAEHAAHGLHGTDDWWTATHTPW